MKRSGDVGRLVGSPSIAITCWADIPARTLFQFAGTRKSPEPVAVGAAGREGGVAVAGDSGTGRRVVAGAGVGVAEPGDEEAGDDAAGTAGDEVGATATGRDAGEIGGDAGIAISSSIPTPTSPARPTRPTRPTRTIGQFRVLSTWRTRAGFSVGSDLNCGVTKHTSPRSTRRTLGCGARGDEQPAADGARP